MSTGKLGAYDLAQTTDTLLAQADDNMVVTVRLVNRGASTAKVRLAIGPSTGTGPALADYIEYDAQLPPSGVLENSGLVLSQNEKIWARSDTAGVSARVHGMPAA